MHRGFPPLALDLPFQWVAFQSWKLRGVAALLPVVRALPWTAPRRVLLIAGTKSPLEQGRMRKLYVAAGEPRALWEVPEAGHLSAYSARLAEHEQRVTAIFDDVLAPIE